MAQERLNPVDLNNADFETISRLPMVGEKRAHFIIDNRPYQSWEDLKKVPGISDRMVEDLKNGNATLEKR